MLLLTASVLLLSLVPSTRQLPRKLPANRQVRALPAGQGPVQPRGEGHRRLRAAGGRPQPHFPLPVRRPPLRVPRRGQLPKRIHGQHRALHHLRRGLRQGANRCFFAH